MIEKERDINREIYLRVESRGARAHCGAVIIWVGERPTERLNRGLKASRCAFGVPSPRIALREKRSAAINQNLRVVVDEKVCPANDVLIVAATGRRLMVAELAREDDCFAS